MIGARVALGALVLTMGCGGTEPGPADDPGPSDPEPTLAEDPDPAPVDEPSQSGELTVRIALVNTQIPANASPMTDEHARLEARMFVRGAPGTQLTLVVPIAHEVEWALVAADGTRWEPMFLPPPMPRPGGPPTTTLTIAASGEVEVGLIHGISGFRRPGDSDWQEGLPVGVYQVTVSDFDLGTGARFAAPPVTLTVR